MVLLVLLRQKLTLAASETQCVSEPLWGFLGVLQATVAFFVFLFICLFVFWGSSETHREQEDGVFQNSTTRKEWFVQEEKEWFKKADSRCFRNIVCFRRIQEEMVRFRRPEEEPLFVSKEEARFYSTRKKTRRRTTLLVVSC